MSDYIKREDAINAIADMMCFETNAETSGTCTRADFIDDAKDWLSEAQTADVEEVVRCMDCKHWSAMQNLTGACLRQSVIDGSWWTGADATDFCSFAERRDDETD